MFIGFIKVYVFYVCLASYGKELKNMYDDYIELIEIRVNCTVIKYKMFLFLKYSKYLKRFKKTYIFN